MYKTWHLGRSTDKPRPRCDLQRYFDEKYSKHLAYSSSKSGYIGWVVKGVDCEIDSDDEKNDELD